MTKKLCACDLKYCHHPKTDGDSHCLNSAEGAEVFCQYCKGENRQAAKVEKTKRDLNLK